MVMVQGVGRSRAGVALRLTIVAAAVTACGSLVKMEPPAADGPRISGREIVAIEPVPPGDALVALAPRRPGVYACQVQVADRSGRWSNVLQTRIAVDAAPAGEASRCA